MLKSDSLKKCVLLGAWLLVACSSHGPKADAAKAARAVHSCSAQVIVAFSGFGQSPPDENLVKSVATVTATTLTYRRSISTELHVFTLSAAQSDPDCANALGRLRADSRVRSVDIDQKRAHH